MLYLLLALASHSPTALPQDAAQTSPRNLTLEEASGRTKPRVSFSRSTPSWSWHEDGSSIAQGRDLFDPATGEAKGNLPEAKPNAYTEFIAKMLEIDEESRKGIRVVDTAEDAEMAAVSYKDDYYFVNPGAVLNSTKIEAPELIDMAPDGSYIGYVTDNNLMVWDKAKTEVRALTTDGNAETFNGKLDWVYQEEIYGRYNFKGFWWSPNSQWIAYLHLNEEPVHEFTVIDHIPADGSMRVDAEVTNYPKVGDPNPIASLWVTQPGDSTQQRALDLSKYKDEEFLIVKVGWNPAGDRLLFQVQDRIQTWLDLCEADPLTGKVRTLIHESSAGWVDVLSEPRFLENGDFLWESERTGHRHLYRYSPTGEPLGAVTAGDWDMLGITRLDEAAGKMWFTTNKDGAINRQTYVIGLDGTGLTRLTQEDGWHSVSVAANGWLLDRFSSLTEPPQLRVCKPDGEIVRRADTQPIASMTEYNSSQWQLHEVTTRDGFQLDAALLKPTNFDENGLYPVWLDTYSGPDAPTIRNRWNSSAWFQFLAQQGFIVLQVNVRSASGKGQEAIESCYRNLGITELEDLEDTVDWLCANPWADRSRVGMTGWSYGGFITAFALTHSDKFALGIAGAGVYDWRMYDTIYTERYMQTPELNPEGYAKTSVLEAAANLKGHLVLLHGTMDDNVHFQNTVQLAYRLQKADKDFELMIFPESRHGIRDRDQAWQRRKFDWRIIQRELGTPSPN